jgi:L-cysteate sulfo-lyase
VINASVQPVRLGTWPTPLEAGPRLAEALGLDQGDLWFKRDDLCGLGGGGNKVRKLEWTCAAALAAGARTLVTSGAAQSNHARLTSAAGARLGLDVVLVLSGAPDHAASGNLALDGLFGARVVWVSEHDQTPLDEVTEAVASDLRRAGATPYVVPFGGSSSLAAQGYAECGAELLLQIPDVSNVVVALGSGATTAGLISVLGAERVLGVHCGAVADPRSTLARLVSGMGVSIDSAALRLDVGQVGAGYGQLTDAVMVAMLTAARTEGLVLDPIYTGRAMAGLIAAVAAGEIGRGARTVFLHTGGMPGLFGHVDAIERVVAQVREWQFHAPQS